MLPGGNVRISGGSDTSTKKADQGRVDMMEEAAEGGVEVMTIGTVGSAGQVIEIAVWAEAWV